MPPLDVDLHISGGLVMTMDAQREGEPINSRPARNLQGCCRGCWSDPRPVTPRRQFHEKRQIARIMK